VGRQDFRPTGAVDRFGIREYAVEIEKDGIKSGHGRGILSVSRPVVVSQNLDTMPSEEELHAELERLRAENEALKKPARGQMSLKVSEKGALSVYGLGRFPVTLYREQWDKLLGMADSIRQFIKDNDATLKKKE
jgi:hypothetical protein